MHCIKATFLFLAVSLAATAVELQTEDGLSLQLNDKDGNVVVIRLDKSPLPLLANQPGGLSCREFKVSTTGDKSKAKIIDFESETGWAKVDNGEWQNATGAAAVRQNDGGAENSHSYLRAGATKNYGDGVRFTQNIAVEPGEIWQLSWQARVPDASATYLLYIRLFDAQGNNICKEAPTSGKWKFSPWTMTHYQGSLATTKVGGWEKMTAKYLIPDHAASLQIACCLWRGDYVDIDNLKLEQIGRSLRSPLSLLPEKLEEQNDGTYKQTIKSTDQTLAIQLQYLPEAGYIHIKGNVQNLDPKNRERALELSYSLPLNVLGWKWHDSLRSRRIIEAGKRYSNNFNCLGHPVSEYPFSVVGNGKQGITLATHLDCPRLEWREYSQTHGFRTIVDLGLSPHTKFLGSGKASFSFLLYRNDGNWGLRSAAAKYYRLFPQFFTKRTKREGAWHFVVRPSSIPNPEDFGLTFWEGYSKNAKERAFAREHGLYILPYTECWGLRQTLKPDENGNLPSYDEALRILKQWAREETTELWRGMPRQETAQAMLNSMLESADGNAPYTRDKYGSWAQWWRSNSSPHLPAPNRWSICKRHMIDPKLAHADGVYLDSVSLWTFSQENYRRDHLAHARHPLGFNSETGGVCQMIPFAHYEFMDWLDDYLHEKNKLVHMNIFPKEYRFYSHLGDILGSEVGSMGQAKNRRLHEVDSDAHSLKRRVYAYRKPTTNLLQEGNYKNPVPALTHAQVRQYIEQQAFYGFYPAISTIGGEEKPGYKGWKRYLGTPEYRERDRGLFKIYIPLIRRLNQAAWEPITHATCVPESSFVERFGSWQDNSLHFTLRNSTDKAVTTELRLDKERLGIDGKLQVIDLVTEENLLEKGQILSFTIKPYGTRIIQVKSLAGKE